MFSEHQNGGVEFLANEFPSVGEIKKDVQLYELQRDNQLYLSEGKNLNTHQVTEDSYLSVLLASDRNLVEKDNENLSAL